MNTAAELQTTRARELFSLDEKHALISGGGSGIGQTIGEALASAGARVTLIGRRADALRKSAARIHQQGGRAEIYACDLTELARMEEHVAAITAQHQSPDILVNAAGWRKRESASDTSVDAWQRTLDTNLSAPFFLARACAPAMCARGWGRIVNIASLQSKLAFAGGIAYGASKGGVAQLTRAMAIEWSAHGVTANAIAPGFFPTALTAPLFADDDTAAALAARTAIGRNGQLTDLVGAAIFLCAPASDYITGQVLYIDGGFTAK